MIATITIRENPPATDAAIATIGTSLLLLFVVGFWIPSKLFSSKVMRNQYKRNHKLWKTKKTILETVAEEN